MTQRIFLDRVKPLMPKMRARRFSSRTEEQLNLLVSQTPIERVLDDGGQLLEVGSGFGGTVFLLRSIGVKAYGIDPASRQNEVSAIICNLAEIPSPFSLSSGEKLPFADNQFEIVCSFETLEHVQNPERVVAEMSRVTKIGGYILVSVPNYGSIIEGHFMLPWFPYMPRRAASLYVRLMSKFGLTNLHREFLDHLNFLTPRWLERIFNDHGLEILDWGIDLWESRLRSLQIPESASLRGGTFTRMLEMTINIAERLGLMNLVIRLGGTWRMHYPIVLTACKKSHSVPSSD